MGAIGQNFAIMEKQWNWVRRMTFADIEFPQTGELVIPIAVSTAIGWHAGDKLTVQVQDGEIRIFSQAQAVQRAQAWVASFVEDGRSLADELIAERRSEALGE
jgi:antitoxin component of MazEF toxin-antitoxin module